MQLFVSLPVLLIKVIATVVPQNSSISKSEISKLGGKLQNVKKV
jgi:hypothetical protein